jgi:methyltransferase (TIGR00027 family)
MQQGHASRTAVMVCQGRAVADGVFAVGRFSDAVARASLDDAERADVDACRAWLAAGAGDDVGAAGRERFRRRLRFELLRTNAEVMAPRTVAIDDAVAAAGHRQVVVLGAGLDGRAFRLAAWRDVDVFYVDHPDSQRDARARTSSLAPLCRLHHVAVDFAVDDVGVALAAAGHGAGVTTTWIWEGVVPYLTAAQVEQTLTKVAARSAPGSRLITAYQQRTPAAFIGRALAAVMSVVGGDDNPFAKEPLRSTWTPSSWAALLSRHGFVVDADDSLADLGAGLGVPASRPRSVSAGRVAVATRR